MFVAHSDRPFECCATEPAYPAFAHEGTGLPLGANLGEAVPMSETVALLDILRQSTDADMVRSIKRLIDEIALESIELPRGEKALISLTLPAQFVIVFDPVTHGTQFIDVKGEPTRERQSLSVVFNDVRAPTGTVEMRPGPLRLSLENRT